MIPLPEQYIELLQRTPQNPQYHAEGNVYIHTHRVLEAFEEYRDNHSLTADEEIVLYWACILHDIGKPFVTKWKENRWTAKGHEDAGVPHAREILLRQKEITTAQRIKILNLVRWHHVPLNWMLNQIPFENFEALSTSVDIKQVGLFASFDIKGRDCQKKEEILALGEKYCKEIVPKIEEKNGTLEYMNYQYGGFTLKHQNALWDAFSIKNAHLWSKLIRANHQDSEKSVFQCIMPIGIPDTTKPEFLQSLYPDALYLSTKAWGIDGLLPENEYEKQRIITTFQHHLSMYARKNRVVVLTGDHIYEETRKALVNIVKNLKGKLTYYFFDTLLEDSIARNLAQPNPLSEPEIRIAHKTLRYPHPWEAHSWFMVTNPEEKIAERVI